METSDEELKRREENTRKVFAIRHELTKESDRGCALMASSFLDNELMILLQDKFVGQKKFREDLFEANGPLGTFSSRIKLAYALGFISKEIRDEFDLIRKIRNEFGHKYEAINFETDPIRSWILNLKQTFYKKDAKPRSIFNNTVLGVLSFIHAESIQRKKFEEKKHFEISQENRDALRENSEILSSLIIDIVKKNKDEREQQ